jgi:hypothetical protein
MRIFERLFPREEVRAALQSIANLERGLPESVGPHLGFDAIKQTLRQHAVKNPQELRVAAQNAGLWITRPPLACLGFAFPCAGIIGASQSKGKKHDQREAGIEVRAVRRHG